MPLPPGFILDTEPAPPSGGVKLPPGFELETREESNLRASAEGHLPSLRPQEPRGHILGAMQVVEDLRDWITGEASDQRITDKDREAARAAGIGLVPNKRELAEAALTAGAIIATPQLAAAAPATTALAFGGSMAATPIGGKLGEVLGEEIGPGVGETYGRPVGEFAASTAGGGAAVKASPALGRATQRAGRRVYASGLGKPSGVRVVESGPQTGTTVPLTRADVADELINGTIPVRASSIRAKAVSTTVEKIHSGIKQDVLAFSNADPRLKPLADRTISALDGLSANDKLKAGPALKVLRSYTAELRRLGHTDLAKSIEDDTVARMAALTAARTTTNVAPVGETLAVGGAGLGTATVGSALGASIPGAAVIAPAAALAYAGRQPIVRRAAGAGLVNVGRSLERGPLDIMAVLRGVGRGGGPDEFAEPPAPTAPPSRTAPSILDDWGTVEPPPSGAAPATSPAKPPAPTAPTAPTTGPNPHPVGSAEWREFAFSRANGPQDLEWSRLGGSKARRAFLESQGKVSEGEPPIGRGGRREAARSSRSDPNSIAPNGPLDRMRAVADADAATIGEPTAPSAPPTPSVPEGTTPELRAALSKTPAGRSLQARIDAVNARPEPASLLREANRAASEFNLAPGSKVWFVAGNDGAPVSWHPSQQQAARATKGRSDLSVRWTRALAPNR